MQIADSELGGKWKRESILEKAAAEKGPDTELSKMEGTAPTETGAQEEAEPRITGPWG